MTHYTVDFSKLEGDAKRKAAVKEIKAYLGTANYKRISDQLIGFNSATPITSYIDLIVPLSLVGVQGYPVIAWYETLFGPRTEQQIAEDKARLAHLD